MPRRQQGVGVEGPVSDVRNVSNVKVATEEMTNDELIELMQRRAGVAPEPGGIAVRDVVHRGDADAPVPMVVDHLSSAGYTYIYDTRTGERSVTNRNMLIKQLEKKRLDGSAVFTVTKPDIEPVRGTMKCMLHADDSNRPEYDMMGLDVCPKANLPNLYQVLQHMKHRHPDEWGAIEDRRLRAEKEQDRGFQQSLLILAGRQNVPTPA